MLPSSLACQVGSKTVHDAVCCDLDCTSILLCTAGDERSCELELQRAECVHCHQSGWVRVPCLTLLLNVPSLLPSPRLRHRQDHAVCRPAAAADW